MCALWPAIFSILSEPSLNDFFWGITPFITLIFPFFSTCSTMLIVNKSIIGRKKIPISSFLVSLIISIIIFVVTKLFLKLHVILIGNIYGLPYNYGIYTIVGNFGHPLYASVPRNIFLSVLVGIGEVIVLKCSQSTQNNIQTPQIIPSIGSQTNYTNTITRGEKMFCRNCGNEMNDNAVVCVKCGAAKGSGNSYCPNCGKETNPNAAVCLNCGYALIKTNVVAGESAKSKLVAGLLALFLGTLGIHNFYLGYTQRGLIQLLITLLGSCLFFIGPIVTAIWALVEAIFIFTGKINVDGKGNPLKD